MNTWIKKPVTRQQIAPLCTKFGLDELTASILFRRDITDASELLYFLENDLRFQHNPFLFSSMEDAVERIITAKEEGEKVLIFGDSDVDGITSTAILYEYLCDMGLDVYWRLPLADAPYGLSMEAIDELANQGGTLIITVDCGISNFVEIQHANELGIDVIVTDHHNPQEALPEAIIIVNPKVEDNNYPFKEISGAAVAYKLVSALRFAETDFYNAEICIIDINYSEEEKLFYSDCVKIKNLIRVKELHEKIIPGKTSIYDLRLPYFLQGQLIYAWNSKNTKDILAQIFGSGIEFNINDLSSDISRLFPSLRSKTPIELKDLSKIGKYFDEENTSINALYNLYVSYCKKIIATKYPKQTQNEKNDLQLVALAALADVMPMKNENRIFVQNGLQTIKKEGPRAGLAELFNKLKLNREAITSKDLSWTIIPALNAAGRMGQSIVSLELLINKNPKERELLANKIYDFNEERKALVSEAVFTIKDISEKSFQKNNNKIVAVFHEKINSGVTGIVASKLMQEYNVPSIALTYSGDVCVGSMRSCRGFISTQFLDKFQDFFINHGGHDFAAGFSFTKDKLLQFFQIIEKESSNIVLSDSEEVLNIDAEISKEHMSVQIFDLLEKFEPYGSDNSELIFISRNIPVCDGMAVGKKDPTSLKLVFDYGKIKIPAMFWGQGNRLNNDILIGQNYDIMFTLDRNYFNGISSPQIIIKEIRKS